MTALAEWSESLHVTGATVFAPSADSISKIHVRSFAPAHGIPEDPVCGSGNLSVGVFLRENGLVERFGATYVASGNAARPRRQGVSPSGSKQIEIGGHAVTCVEGTLRI